MAKCMDRYQEAFEIVAQTYAEGMQKVRQPVSVNTMKHNMVAIAVIIALS